MSNTNNQNGLPAPSVMPLPPEAHAVGNRDLTAELKRRLEETCLPADLKEQILAQLPSPEERERLFRELRDKGGLSSEQFFASLDLEREPQP